MDKTDKTEQKAKIKKTKSKSKKQNNPHIQSELLDSSLKIKNDLKTVNERLEKMKNFQSEVSHEVYNKVKLEYVEQKKDIQEQFESKRKEVSKLLLTLYQNRKDKEEQLASLEQILEEAKFRNLLGEYSETAYDSVKNEQAESLGSISSDLETLSEAVLSYEDLIGGPLDSIDMDFPEPDLRSEPASNPESELDSVPELKSKIESASEPEPKAELKPEAETKPEPEPEPESEPESEKDPSYFQAAEGDYFASEPEPKVEDIQETSLESLLNSIPTESGPESGPESKPESEVAPEIESKSEAQTSEESFESSNNQPKLELIEGELEESEILVKDTISIGRSPGNDIVLKEPKVSRQHAAINFEGGSYSIVDLKSSNGVYINAKKVEEQILNDGDIIQIGSFQFKYSA